MKLNELSRNQLKKLKCDYMYQYHKYELSYDEIYNIDTLVSDYLLSVAYSNTDFVEEDFI